MAFLVEIFHFEPERINRHQEQFSYFVSSRFDGTIPYSEFEKEFNRNLGRFIITPSENFLIELADFTTNTENISYANMIRFLESRTINLSRYSDLPSNYVLRIGN